MGDLLNQFLKSIRKRIHKFLLFFQVVIQRLSLQFELLVCVFEESDLGRFQYERLGLEELGFFGVPKTWSVQKHDFFGVRRRFGEGFNLFVEGFKLREFLEGSFKLVGILADLKVLFDEVELGVEFLVDVGFVFDLDLGFDKILESLLALWD
jgi:hypothetical protein